MAQISEEYRGVRDRPISNRLRTLLTRAATDAGIDKIVIYSGGQPGSSGRSVGSPRHNGGNAGDLHLFVKGRIQRFTDRAAPKSVTDFVSAAAKYGATGVGAAEGYMGPTSLHVGFGSPRTVWGKNGRRKNAPAWLVKAFESGWNTSAVSVQNFIVVARAGVPLKLGPGNDFDTIDRVPADTLLFVISVDGAQNDWARVDLVGDGYVDGHIHVSALRQLADDDTFLDFDNLDLEQCEHSHIPDQPDEKETIPREPKFK